MKVAILGYGNVGMATFHTFMHMPEIHELVLCGRNKDKIEGELADFQDSLALNSDIKTRIRGGGYEMTAGADIIVYTIGPSIKDHNADRMSLSKVNIDIAREVSEELNKYNKDAMSNAKFDDLKDQITLYREHIIYLHYAEALNRAGYPTAAFAVLKYGIYEELTERAEGDPISADERAKAGSIIDFPRTYFTRSNTMGIHSRGCGDAIVNPEYVIPSLATANDTMLWVEDKVIDELALETIFEGHRYYDLMRVALRRGDNNYLASRVAARNGKGNVDAALQNRLTNSMNWYLPMLK